MALAVLALLGGIVWLPTELRLGRTWPVPAHELDVPRTREAIERGRHVAEAITLCGHCHGADLGGAVVADLPGLGRLWASNLTPGRSGPAPSSTSEWVAAVRHGVDSEGRTLVAMPSEHLRSLSDADLGAVVAYLEQVPPVDRDIPARRIGLLARLSFLLGRGTDVLSAERTAARPAPAPAPPAAATPEYGAYLARVGLCHLCHHEDLSGGLHPLALPEEPVPADLRPGGLLEAWSRDDFGLALRAGVTPDGRTLDPAWMPWPRYAQLTDLELDALWSFLRTLPAPANGSPP